MEDKLLLYVKNCRKFYEFRNGKKFPNKYGVHMWIYEDKLVTQAYWLLWRKIALTIFAFLIMPIPYILLYGILEFHNDLMGMLHDVNIPNDKQTITGKEMIADAHYFYKKQIERRNK